MPVRIVGEQTGVSRMSSLADVPKPTNGKSKTDPGEFKPQGRGAKETIQEGTENVKQQAAELTSQAKQQIQEKSGQAKERVQTEFDRRSSEAGLKISKVAEDLRSVSQQLREQGRAGPATNVAEKGADKVDLLAAYLVNADGEQIAEDLERFARKQPWGLAAAAFLTGFAASRLVKAANENEGVMNGSI